MEHPGLDIRQIKEDHSLEEIQAKIGDLNNRLTFAYKTANQSLMNQLSMVLEVYIRAQQEILEEKFGGGGDDVDLDSKIDIT